MGGPATGVLTVTGWSGSAGSSGTNDRVVFSGGTAPDADFLQHIRFDMGGGTYLPGTLRAGGELVPAGSPSGVTVPSVVNLTQAAASASINGAGLVVGTVSAAASSTVAAGSVISQNPAGGSSVASGSAVNLVVSTGPSTPTSITLANARSARGTTQLSSIDLSYTVPNVPGQSLVLVVYGGAECSTSNLALPRGATFHGVAMNVAAQHRTTGTGANVGAGLYWRAVSPNESGTIQLRFTGNCSERAIGAVTLVGAAATGPEVVETATGTRNLTDQIRTRTANALVISTATHRDRGALTATGTGHVLDLSAALNSSRVVAGHATIATPTTRTLGFSRPGLPPRATATPSSAGGPRDRRRDRTGSTRAPGRPTG
ncbi:MAG: PASTA domain-containing protein [Actinobacteria bacterium]|nr:PASTA domain-containing protein [Actinomycetota bacterium]